MSKMSLA